MKPPIAFRLSKREVAFLLISFAVLAAGTALSIKQCHAEWMAGVGAIVIVLGIVFAVSDLPNILQLKADQWASVRKEFAVQARIDEIEEETHTLLSEDERRKIRREVESIVDKLLPSAGPAIRRRFRLVEVFIVCTGTLVNGLGQPVLEWLLR